MQTYQVFAKLTVFHLRVFLADKKFDNGHNDLSQTFYGAFPEFGLMQFPSFLIFGHNKYSPVKTK